MRHRKQLALAVALLGLFAAPAHAQSGDGVLRGMLRQCALIADIPARVACYDAIPQGEPEAPTAAVAPSRFFAGFVPHGSAPGYWVPEKAGALEAELPFVWKPLEPFRDQVTIMSGLHSTSAEPIAPGRLSAPRR